MQNFVELIKDHVQITIAVDELTAVTRHPKSRPTAAYEALRRLAHLLDAHLRAEEEFLSEDRNAGREEFTLLANEHGAMFDDLVCEWGIYLGEWDQENIACDWEHFATATDWIATRLHEQVDAENRSLYPAALHYGLVRLLPEKVSAA